MSNLVGRHIVVTRPLAQAAHLLQALLERGAVPVKFPVLAIHDLQDSSAIVDAAIRLDGFDLVIFVSPNAVEKALDVILKQRQWPSNLLVATMGRSSEQALAARGITRVIAPSLRFDSEALLDLPELQSIKGQRILICRGDGGRELLGTTLKERGALVEFLTCYQRVQPSLDAAPLLSLWQEGKFDAVTLTSSEGLRNFCAMIGRLGMAWLKHTPTFVTHTRIAEFARDEGLESVVLTEPGDDGLLVGLEAYFANHGIQH
ncbi:MAG: uroporphyrinogen-III synthase [Rhodocyclaceae bacterium]|nr:uroporphyrinogen-III synthase [Rhodocyclaceae bacterium]MBP6109355.1 uroporphyrinogen-III synthase [Rhodocyclaceae bacterium]MBP6279376.1 uroporphyrinogen-III synthase [Rhodocyclaceae bacterium]